MQFTNIALLAIAGFVAAEKGFTAPKGAADGVYTVYRRDDGTEHHEAVETTFSAKFARSIPDNVVDNLSRRTTQDGWQSKVTTTCASNAAPMVKADVDKANDMLDAQCKGGRKVGRGLNLYSISGGTVAYFCNFGNMGDDICNVADRRSAAADITAKCKAYVPGWRQNETEPASYISGGGLYSYSFGYERAEAPFCGCGTKC